MRIYIVIDENSFFHPSFLNDLLKNIKDEVVGVALVCKIPEKNNLGFYLMKNWYYLTILEIAKLLCNKIKHKIFDISNLGINNENFGSVRSVLKKYQIDFIKVENNINKKNYLKHIHSAKPDVILSSNSLIFNNEILSASRICCINRHSSLLPSYGGLWPIFHAYINREKYVGVSVHIMNKKIDSGHILSQEKIQIEKIDTIFTLYKKCFNISSRVVISALDKIRKSDMSLIQNNYETSYFSFPQKKDWKLFRKYGGKFI